MSRTAIIVQARMASTRLPGKVMMELAGRSVLSHVLERCRLTPGADMVCCAIPDGADCDPIAAEAERCGAEVFRGDEHDTLGRYAGAARMVDADVILRVTSDCPLIDPTVCGEVLDLHARAAADFTSNNTPPSWPHGLDCEAFTRDLLERADATASDPYEREHVSPWMRAVGGVSRANLSGPDRPGGDLTDHRWTLDYPEDFAFFTALFHALPALETGVPGWRAIDEFLADHPELSALNQMRHAPAAAAAETPAS